jgi:hypothetical protein
VSDELARWASTRAPDLIARAEAEAVAEIKAALLQAVSLPAPTVAPRREQQAVRPASAEPLLWAYCVAHAAESPRVELPGVGDGVEWIEHAGLVAAVSRVSAHEFGEDVLPDSLNDLAWLERVARAHEAVLERVGDETTIVPLRLCTIFADADGVRRMVDDNKPMLLRALTRLKGRQEWAVKLLVDRGKLEAASGVDEETESAGSGTAYLLGRRAERERREAADRLARELAEDVHARIQDFAIDAVVNPPQRRELSGHVGEMLLNGAYLVERTAAGELSELAAQLEQRHEAVGARIEVTGPLPPFNFASLAEGDREP